MRFFVLIFLMFENAYAHRVSLGFTDIKHLKSGDNNSLTIQNNLDIVAMVQLISNKKGIITTIKVNQKKEKKIALVKTKGEKLFFMGVRPPTKKIILE